MRSRSVRHRPSAPAARARPLRMSARHRGTEPRPSSPSPRGWCAWSDGGPAPPPGQRPHGGRRQLARPERRAGLARARLRRARGAREAGAAVGPAHAPLTAPLTAERPAAEGKAAAQGRAAGGGSRGAPGPQASRPLRASPLLAFRARAQVRERGDHATTAQTGWGKRRWRVRYARRGRRGGKGAPRAWLAGAGGPRSADRPPPRQPAPPSSSQAALRAGRVAAGPGRGEPAGPPTCRVPGGRAGGGPPRRFPPCRWPPPAFPAVPVARPGRRLSHGERALPAE